MSSGAGAGGTVVTPLQPADPSRATSKIPAAPVTSEGVIRRTNESPGRNEPAQAVNQAAAGTQKPGWPRPLPADADLSKLALIDIISQQVNLEDPEARAEQARQVRLIEDARRAAAWARAEKMGLLTKGKDIVLIDFDGDRPVYLKSKNRLAAISTAADQVRNSTDYPWVNGTGVTVGVWDGGPVLTTHLAFGRRAINKETNGAFNDHATHVACTVAGADFTGTNGPVVSQGMAPSARIHARSSANDISGITANGASSATVSGDRLSLSNHSYGVPGGWEIQRDAQGNFVSDANGNWVWVWPYAYTDDGNAANDVVVDQVFGQYGSRAAQIDGLLAARPYMTQFWAAGNDRDNGPTVTVPPTTWYSASAPATVFTYNSAKAPTGDGQYKNNGYDTITDEALAKNVITVGAVEDAVATVNNVDVRSVAAPAAAMSGFSDWGPVDDGRIKPDIVANGVGVFSAVATSQNGEAATEARASYNGTSMACPNACGSAALLQQIYQEYSLGPVMRASLLKALIIHTATDLGNAGPDYQYGWGLMNTRAAADLIRLNGLNLPGGRMIEDSVAASGTKTYTFTWDGTKPLRATLCWSDPAATARTTSDDRAPTLTNDLDLLVTGPTGTQHWPYIMPYVGNWTDAKLSAVATNNTATANTTDNVEQVYVPAPAAGLYTITVRHARGTMTGASQFFSLVLSDLTGPPDITVEQPTGTPLTDGVSTVNYGSVTTSQGALKTF